MTIDDLFKLLLPLVPIGVIVWKIWRTAVSSAAQQKSNDEAILALRADVTRIEAEYVHRSELEAIKQSITEGFRSMREDLLYLRGRVDSSFDRHRAVREDVA